MHLKLGYDTVNIAGTTAKTFKVSHKNGELTFSVNSLIARLQPSYLKTPLQFNILQDYIISYNLSKTLFELYQKAYDTIYSIPKLSDIHRIISEIIQALDYNMLKIYISDRYTQYIPAGIPNTFRKQDELDGIGSEDQTYIRQEYIELMTYTSIIKAIAPILAMSYEINPDLYPQNTYIITYMRMINETDLVNTPAHEKLYRFVDKHISCMIGPQDMNLLALSRQISEDDILDYVMGAVIFKRLPIVRYDENIVDLIYKTARWTVDRKQQPKDRVTVKNTNAGEAEEGILDSYRSSTGLTIGELAEYDMVVSDPHKLLRHIGGDRFDILEDALEFFAPFNQPGIRVNNFSFFITKAILHKAIPSPALNYVSKQYTANMLAVAFAYLYPNIDKELALLLTIREVEDDTIVTPPPISRVSGEVADKLMEVYKVRRVKRTKTTVVAEQTPIIHINEITKYLNGKNFVSMATRKYLEERDKHLQMPGDIRIRTAKLLIHLAEPYTKNKGE